MGRKGKAGKGSRASTHGRRAAVGYIRVSTLAQADEGTSLAAQRSAVEARALAMGLELVTVEADEGLSGKRADNRPGLQRALKLACEHNALLIVYSLSRLGRNARETLEIAERLEGADADLCSLSENLDTSGACGRMVFRVLAVLAEFERDCTAERTCLALREKRRRGEKLGGAVPFGFRADRSGERVLLVPDEQEQAALVLMRQLRAEGLSLRGIGARLESEGIEPRSGGRWHAKVLASIVSRAA